MTIQEAIDRLDVEFQKTPLRFTVETALQARLLELLRANVGETIQVRGGYNTADATGYKRKYLDRIAKPQSINSVQPEVNFGMSGEGNRSLDIAVLEPRHDSEYDDLDYLPGVDGPRVTVRLVDGSKYFSTMSVKHAIELKYIKNVDVAGAKFKRENIDKWPHFSADLAKLGDLSNAESRHLIVVSNKNPFQQGEVDNRSTAKAQGRYERVKKECEKRAVELTEIHPRE
ncbi:hypothetical protein [Natranaeroarchaeum aerophilus]|uniref:Uncharacterized protein n=1 Tax=Natranaeroarchaeum aerophilus TaxID=2917711 RepID=A0AAE3K6H8_9EURY|nr:hypothetical protein [Natranaeroarchaeum aerophilus]MCL9814961.1 hypothetical protein [Natranaeroarchaeum aerophilus]